MTLHNAIVPFDGDPIEITDPKTVEVFLLDHSLANGDCTRVVLTDGTTFWVQESVDEVATLIGDSHAT